MHVVRGGQPGSDVEELPDAGFGHQVPDGPAEKGAVLARRDQRGRRAGENRLRRLAVGGEMVLPAEEEVVHPRRVRSRGVNLRR